MPRHTVLLTVMGASLTACITATVSTSSAPSAEGRAVEAAIQGWYDASERHDSAAYAAVMLPEFVIVEDTVRYDRSGILRGVVASFSRGSDHATLSEWDTHVSGEVAWTTFRNTEVFTPRGGTPGSPRRFLESAVLRKVEGQWKLVHYHATRINRPAPR